MKYAFKLAYKNLMRAKRRTILTFAMLSFGIVIYLMMEGMMDGFDDASFQNLIDFETGHFKIRSTEYDEDYPYDIDNYIMDAPKLEKSLKKFNFITGIASRVEFLSEVDNGIDSTPVITIGIDPINDSKVFTLQKYITTGSLEKGGALIGKTLAKDMQITVGDLIYNTKKDSHGMATSTEFLITGIVKTGDPKINSASILINIDEAREMIRVDGSRDISIKTKDFKKIKEYKSQLMASLDGHIIQDWSELSGDFAAIMETKRSITGYFILFIVIIALVGIINTIIMSVYEKRKEIGTLMALGLEKKQIRNIFICEGLIIGLFGTIAGLILGTIVNLYFIYVGIDYSAMIGDQDWGMNISVLKSTWVLPAYFKAFIIVLLASIVASYYPAKKVMKMEPAECLRTVQ